jgi:uncharacterized membrane protein YphA (DoxX/SURF4 family)
VSKFKNGQIIGWTIFLLTLVGGFLIAIFEGFSLPFLGLLFLLMIVTIPFRKSFPSSVVMLSQLLLGALFVFSGFVKGVDPVGTQYRIEDYFIAFGMNWANPLALFLSVVLNTWEFVLGALLLFNIRVKFVIWPVLVTMIVFTIVTVNDATNNPVPDCGCFGDALLISNWQTFYKNLVINVLVLIVFFNRKKNSEWFSVISENILSALIVLGFLGFQYYNIRHLPVLDFRAWKVGNRMVHEDPLPKKYYLTYQNKNTGEQKEYLSPDYPYDDPEWVENWEFVRQRIVDPNPPLHDLSVIDEDGIDYTANLIENPEFQYLMIADDLQKSNLSRIEDMREFIQVSSDRGVSFAMITSSLPEYVADFKKEHELDIDVFYADDIPLKAMIRSNPGLVLLKDGFVIEKWHYNDWPDPEDIP